MTVTPSVWGVTGKQSVGKVDGHSPVNSRGVFQVDTIYRADNAIYFRAPGNANLTTFAGTNLSWIYPTAGGGLDVDVSLSKSWAISLGASYSSAGGKGLWGYRTGLGLRQHKGSLGVRLDVGWAWESIAYEAVTVVTSREISSTTSDVAFFRDIDVSTTGNFYAALTVNGASAERVFNPFIQIGLTRQTLEDYKPTAPKPETWIVPPFYLLIPVQLVHDLRGRFESTRIHVTPGVSIDLDPQFRLLIGARASIETSVENFTDPVLVSPFIQFDWSP
ncbi:MAG: hypothetical protein AB1428_07525 [Bacteroidota bacterium]